MSSGERVVERAVYGGAGRCAQTYPAYGDPRVAAGAPVSIDVLKCSLKPFDAADYRQSLSTVERQKLK